MWAIRDAIDGVPGFIDLPERDYLNIKIEALDLVMSTANARLGELDDDLEAEADAE